MNYIKQLNEFYSTLDYNPLSANAIAMYIILLHIANKTGWVDEFKVANPVLMSKCNFDKQTVERARNELFSKGYINYKKGKNQNIAPIYSINILYTADNVANNIADDTITHITGNVPDNTMSNTADNTTDNTINKQNKTKQNEDNIKKNNKKKYGEFQNVLLDAEQYEKLVNDFPNDYKDRIQSLDDYIQSKGRKYNDHLATIRSWARKEGYQRPENIEDEYKIVCSDNLTQKEYEKIMRGEKSV